MHSKVRSLRDFCLLINLVSLEKTLRCWKRLKDGGEGDNREQDGWRQHRLNEHEFEQTLGEGEGQGSLVCCSLQGHKKLDTTEQMNSNKKE